MPRLNTCTEKKKYSQHTPLSCMQQKEKQSYIALSALVDFMSGEQKPSHCYKPHMDFNEYRRLVLTQVAELKKKRRCQQGSSSENQFTVMHYQRAILSASKANYRNMAIQAAIQNLTPSALYKLTNLIKMTCIKLSKEVVQLETKESLQTRLESKKGPMHGLADAVVLPV